MKICLLRVIRVTKNNHVVLPSKIKQQKGNTQRFAYNEFERKNIFWPTK